MKKAIAIFFLFTFFVFQYGKILDYIECRIAAAVQIKEDCGCEVRLMANTGDASNQSTPLQHHHKNYTEEFFDLEEINHPAVFKKLINHADNYQQGSMAVYQVSIFQPPRI
jgi:hypothetical protein